MGSSTRGKVSASSLLTQHSTVALKPLSNELQEMPEDMQQVLVAQPNCPETLIPISRFPLRQGEIAWHLYVCSPLAKNVGSHLIGAGWR
jgi:hypothetical protein